MRDLLCLSIALLIFGFAVLCAWAVTGPRDITKYAPYVEKSINGALKNDHIKIGRAFIEWTSIDELLSLKADNVQIFDNKTGQQIASLPRVVLKYGFTSIITADAVPSHIKFIEPEINLTNLVHKSEGKGISLEDLNLSRLDTVSLTNGLLIAPDGGKWNVPNATLSYNYGEMRVNAEIRRDGNEQIQVAFRTNPDMTDSYLKASFSNFTVANVAYYIPEITPAHLIVSGRASYTANKTGKHATFSVDKFNGEFDDAKLFKYKLEAKDGRITGSYDLNKKILDISDMHARFSDDFEISAKGAITNFSGFDINASFSNLKTGNIKKYWPNSFGQNALIWINGHLYGGAITDGTAKLKLNPGEAGAGILPKSALALKFNFTNVNNNYIDNLTPVTNGMGNGFMDGDSLTVNATNAVLGNSQVTDAVAVISNIGRPGETLKVSGHVEGPAEDLADFYIKLNKQQKLFKSKGDLSGKASSDITAKLSLLDNLKTDDVEFHVKSEITEATVKNFYNKVDVEHLKMSLTASNHDFNIKGQGSASFGAEGEMFTLTNAPAGFEVVSKGGEMDIAVASDITASAFEFAPLEIKKPAGEPGKISVNLIDDGKQNPVIKKLVFDSKPLQAAASGILNRDYGGFAGLNFSTLQFGRTNLQARIVSTPYLTAELKGKYFDAAPIIRFMKKDHKQDDSQYKILLKADSVGLLNDRSLNDVFITIQCGVNCDVINIGSKEIMFSQSGGTLKIKTENAGNILDGFDIYSNMIGGKMDVTAKANGSIYDGKITINDFSIVKAKVLARMLTLGSLTGIADILAGNGIGFKKLSSEFHMDKHELNVSEYRMVGAAIGITAKGSIDRDKNVADVSGNIIPSYTANTLLGNIPLIGPVVIGDEGVFALAYKLTGNVDDPSMSVNPLSILAPGFLKNVFQ